MNCVASVYAIVLAEIIVIIFSFSGYLTELLTAIPALVLCDILVLLYCFIL